MNGPSGRRPLPGRGGPRSGSGTETPPDLHGSGVAAWCRGYCRFAAHPAIAAPAGAAGHGATSLAVVAVVLLVLVAVSARDDRRRAHRRRAVGPSTATVVGLVLLVLGVAYLAAKALA